MIQIILRMILAFIISLNISGCSLFSSSDDGEETDTATVAEESADAAGDDLENEFNDEFEKAAEDVDFDPEAMASESEEKPAAEENKDFEAEDDFLAEGSSDEEFASDDYADDDYASQAGAEKSASQEGDSLVIDEGGLPSGTLTQNQEKDLFADNTPVVDTPVFEDNFGSAHSANHEKSYIPVKKMKAESFRKAGANVNRLYVVRSGDSIESIADKIYGNSSMASSLYSYNPHFKGKSLNVGDKIYYQSPNNSNDNRMMTYYEDVGINPQYYTSRDGDNIRKVSRKLLGHSRSWMEVWATNSQVQSKGEIPGGLQLRYWPEGLSADPIQASAPTPPPSEPEMVEPDDMAMNEPQEEMPPAEEPTEIAMNDEPEPAMDEPSPKMDEPKQVTPPPAQANVASPPPKPPVAPPPPPAPKAKFNKPAPPKKIASKDKGGGVASMADDSMIMGGLGGLLILAAIIMLIFIRRSRAKRVNFSQTQV